MKTTDYSDYIKQGLSILESEKLSCVLIKNGNTVYKSGERGIKPLLDLLELEPRLLSRAFVVDKIIGKAAALLLLKGGAEGVYGQVMSAAALQCLTARGIPAGYGAQVDYISNRAGNGACPMETAVMDINDPETAYAKLKETLKQLQGS